MRAIKSWKLSSPLSSSISIRRKYAGTSRRSIFGNRTASFSVVTINSAPRSFASLITSRISGPS